MDGWRGASILLVLIGHFLLERITWLAPTGVELFFVLSGRLMADILFVERFPLGEFYKRRFSRIYPGLVAFVLLSWLLTSRTELSFKGSAVATALTFTINYAMVLKHGVSAIENLWSLCIEEHAYLLLGLIAFGARRLHLRPMPFLAVIAGASIIDALVSSVLLRQDYFTVYWRTDAHLASIFLAAIAYLALRGRDIPSWLSPLAFLAGLGIMAIGADAARFSLGTAFFALSIATLDRAVPSIRGVLSSRILTAAGVWSFSLYLWQQPLFRLERAGHLLNWLALAIAVAAGLASFYLVEQPARRWLNRNLRFPRPKRVAPVATAT